MSTTWRPLHPGRFPTMGVTFEPQNGNPLKQGPKVLAAA